MLNSNEAISAASELEATALTALGEAFDAHALDRVAISFSGAEDVVLIDLASRLLGGRVPVFSLDTGRLHPETYQYLDVVREHYGIEIDVVMPDAGAVRQLVRAKGLFSFYRDGHQECCAVRKIEPLRQKLATLDAWITGQRRDQGVTRAEVPLTESDAAFSTATHVVTKYNPLSFWNSADVWDYIRKNRVPYNALHDRGFSSIGCEPCTRPITPHQPEREGRWWWESADHKECGLHPQNAQRVKVVG